jgi:hypothetical protein
MRRALVTSFLAAVVAVHCAPAPAESHDSPAQGVPPTTFQSWARGAQLFGGLGHFHRKITTRSNLTQHYFDQGMRFLWAFNHDEATRSFAKAAQLDPACASCYWGGRSYAGAKLQYAADG